jgi:NAD(P)-dependent dehydrogenase (short-subunit alcohol dehydrogenase family)
MKIAFITGCSSGIGKAAANFFANKGWNARHWPWAALGVTA